MLKASGVHGTQWLTNVIKQVWNSGVILSDWRKGIILPINKGKGSPKDCSNYLGITNSVNAWKGVRCGPVEQSS